MSNPKKGNVLINGRTVVHKESGGVLITTDVCLTKIGKSTVPITYTNVARSVDADKTSSTVFVNGHPICHKNSIFSKSTGDEPGNRLGIRSGTITGKAEFITGSPNVFIEGIPAVRQGDMMVSNNCNTAPMPLSQPGAPIARTFKLSQVTPPEETELPDKIHLGQSGEQAQLLRGLYRGDNGSNTAKAAKSQRIFQYIDREGSERYKELLSNNLESGTQHLSLLFNDKEFDSTDEEDKEYIVIPLGSTKTVKKDSPHPRSPKEFANFTVPIILKRYSTAEFDKAQTAELRQGWLYIYRNGYLWRELQVRENSFMADVNLRRHQGKHTRRVSGESDSRVIVPWKIDNQVQTIEIAFSEVQWSWARINAMGGMEPDTTKEPRLKNTTPMPTLSASETAKNRQQRMQDITGELGQWILGEGQDTENIQSAENVTSEIFTMLLHKNSKLPVLFLQDHLALLRQIAYKAHQAAGELDEMHRHDEDAHKRTIADIAISILDSYPDYSKYLRSHEDMHVFCNNFDGRLGRLQHNYNTAQDDLISFLQEKRPVFMTIWDDYSTDRKNVPDHQQDLEEIWYSFLSAISPFVSRETAAGEVKKTEEPDRLAKLLGSFEEPTPEGEAFFDRVFLVSDRTTGHSDNLVGLLGNFLAKQQSSSVIERIFERYRLSGHKVTEEFQEIVFVPGNYLDKLPGQLRWGTAIDSISGKPVTAIKGGKIIVPQLFVNGKAINTIEITIEKMSVETVKETVREQSRVRLREKPLSKVHTGLRGLQIFNTCWAIKDFRKKRAENADISTIAAYSANLLSDALGFAAMLEKEYAAFFARNAAPKIAQAYATMTIGFLNAVSGLLLAVFESKMAYDEWQSGDKDAAVAKGTSAIGLLLFALGRLGSASEAAATLSVESSPLANIGFTSRLATLTRFAPVLRLCGWIGVAMTIGGTIYYLYADNNPLEDWLNHCAWGDDAYDGIGTVTNRQGEKETINYASWQDNPGEEIAAALPLMVGYAAEAKWTDNRKKLANFDFKPLWEQLKQQPQGFDLSVTVPPFKHGKLILDLFFIDELGKRIRFFNEKRHAESYHNVTPAQVNDKPAGNGPASITHSWGIGVADIPSDAVQADIRLWFDPYGDGSHLLPNTAGLQLIAHKGSKTHVQSI